MRYVHLAVTIESVEWSNCWRPNGRARGRVGIATLESVEAVRSSAVSFREVIGTARLTARAAEHHACDGVKAASGSPQGTLARAARRSRSADGLRTIDIVVVSLANLGGATKPIDIEDVAIEAYRLAPHRFGWRRHPEQVDMAGVRDGLSDARKPENGLLVVGDRKHGWTVTPDGLELADRVRSLIKTSGPDSKMRLDIPVRAAERSRVLRSRALQKASDGLIDSVTRQEVRELLRVDPSVSDEKYQQRLAIVLNAFSDEPDVRSTIAELERRLREGGLSR